MISNPPKNTKNPSNIFNKQLENYFRPTAAVKLAEADSLISVRFVQHK